MADLRLESEQNKILSMSAAPSPLASHKVVQNAGLQMVLMFYEHSVIHVFCLFFFNTGSKYKTKMVFIIPSNNKS